MSKKDYDHPTDRLKDNEAEQTMSVVNDLLKQRMGQFPIESTGLERDLSYLSSKCHSGEGSKLDNKSLSCSNENMNQWYHHPNMTSLYTLLASNESIANEVYSAVITSEETNEQKALFQKQLDAIQQDEDLMSKYILMKITLNNIFSLNHNNIEEMLKYAKLLKENNSCYFTDYKMIFFFGKDLVKLMELIETLIDQGSDAEMQMKLLEIVLHIADGFKSLYCYMFFIKKIEGLTIRKGCDRNIKGFLDGFKIDIEKELSDIRKVYKNKEEQDETMMMACEEILTEDLSSAVLASKDTLIVYNETKETLAKYKRCNGKYTMGSQMSLVGKGQSGIFAYEERIGFIFSYEHFKHDRLDSLISLFNVDTMKLLTESAITMNYDDKVKELFCYKEMNQGNNATMTITDNSIAVALEDHLLYVLYPIPHQENSPTSYALDIIEVDYSHTTKSIQMTMYDSQIISQHETKSIGKGKRNIINDLIFQPSNERGNKFFVVNGMIISPQGKMIYDSKVMKIIYDPKNDNGLTIDNNEAIVLNYKEMILCLSIKKETKSIHEEQYTTITYTETDLFSNHTIMKTINQFMKNRLNDKDNTKQNPSSNSFSNFFQTMTVSNAKERSNDDTQEKVKEDDDSSDILLNTLCHYASIVNYHPYHLNHIHQCLKSPYIINIDSPTLTLLAELIMTTIQSAHNDNDKHLFAFLALFNLQLDQMVNLRLSLLHFLNSQTKIEQLISSLISLKAKSPQLYSISLIIIFKLMRISSMSYEYHATLFNEILQVTIETIDDLYTHSSLLQSLFSYMIHSSKDSKIISIGIVFDLYIKVFDVLIKEQIKSKGLMNQYDLMKVIIPYQNSFLCLFKEMITGEGSSERINIANKITEAMIVNTNKLIENMGEDTYDEVVKYNAFPCNMVIFVLRVIVKVFDTLPYDFILRNMSGVIDLISKLSKEKIKLRNNESNDLDRLKDDIIIDNMSIAEGLEQKITYDLPTNESNTDKERQLYYQLIIIPDCKHMGKVENRVPLGFIKTYGEKEEKYMIEIDKNNKESQYQLIQNGRLKTLGNKIKVKLFPEAKKYYIKMRISTYDTFNENIDMILNPCINLLNKSLSKLSFYTPHKDNSSLIFLTKQTMFIPNSTHIEESEGNIHYNSSSIMNYFKGTTLQSIIPTIEKFNTKSIDTNKEDLILPKDGIDQYLFNKTYDDLLNDYNKRINLANNENDDTQLKIVKCSFYIILKCMNLLHLLNDIKQYDHLLMCIWRESIKMIPFIITEFNDSKSKQKSIDKEMEEIHSKLSYIFNYPFAKINTAASQQINELDMIRMVRDHIKTLTFVLSSEKCSYDSLKQIKQTVYDKSFNRIISIKLLTFIMNHFTDDELISNVLSTYYDSFMTTMKNHNNKGLPSICYQIPLIEKDKAILLNESFNGLFSSILKKITQPTEASQLTKFTLTSYLNFLLWRINTQAFDYKQLFTFFNIKESAVHLTKPLKYLFNEINPSIMKELRYINDHHIGKLLTDLFDYYTIAFLSNENNNFSKEDNNYITATIVNIIEKELIQLSLASENNSNDTTNSNESSLQSKLHNILFLLDKILQMQITLRKDINILSSKSLWKHLMLIIKKNKDNQNEQVFFNLLKLLVLYYKTDLHKFTSLLMDNTDSTSNTQDILEHLLSFSDDEEIVIDFLQYWYINISQDIMKFITMKILYNEGKHINYISFFLKPINRHNTFIHTNSSIEQQSINYDLSIRELEESIKTGFHYPNWFKRPTKELTQIEPEIIEEEEKDKDNAKFIKKPLKYDLYFDPDKVNDLESDKDTKLKKKIKEIEDCSIELLPHDHTVLLEKNTTSMSTKADIVSVNSNNSIRNTSGDTIPFAKEDNSLIEHCLVIIKRDFAMLKELSPCQIKDCFMIVQLLIKASNEDSKCKEKIDGFLMENDEMIKTILLYELESFNHSIIPREKIEEMTMKVIKKQDGNETKKAEGEMEEGNGEVEEREVNGVVGRFANNEKQMRMVALFDEKDRSGKVIIPLVKCVQPKKIYKEKDMKTFVIDMEEYQKIIAEKEKVDLLKKEKEEKNKEEKEDKEKKDTGEDKKDTGEDKKDTGEDKKDDKKKDKKPAKTRYRLIFLNKEVITLLNKSVIKSETNKTIPKVVDQEKEKNNETTKSNSIMTDESKEHKDDKKSKDDITENKQQEANQVKENNTEIQEKPSELNTDKPKEESSSRAIQEPQAEDSTEKPQEAKSDKTNSLWDPFNAALDSLYDSSCIFLIDISQSCLLQSTFNIFFYQPFFFSSNELTNKSLPSYLKSILPNSKEQTLNSLLPQLQQHKGSLYHSLMSSYKISKNKPTSSSVKSLETFTKDKITYADILKTFPTENTFSIKDLKSYSLFLLKYNLRLLLINHNKSLDSISLQSMFYITDFYAHYFNLPHDYNHLHQYLLDHIASIDLTSMTITGTIINHSLLLVNERDFAQYTQDRLLKELFTIYNSKNDEEHAKSLMEMMIMKCYDCIDNSDFNKFFIVINLILSCLTMTTMKSIMMQFYESGVIKEIDDLFMKKQHEIHQETFMNYLTEIILRIMGLYNTCDYHKKNHYKKLYSDYLVITNKNTKLEDSELVNIFIPEAEDYRNKITTTLSLPSEASKWLIRYKNPLSYSLTLMPQAIGSKQSSSSSSCQVSTIDISNSKMETLDKQEITSESNDLIIIKDNLQTKTYFRQDEINYYLPYSFVEYYDLSEAQMIAKDIKGQFYSLQNPRMLKPTLCKSLEEIRKTETIISIANQCIITNKSIYINCGKTLKINGLEEFKSSRRFIIPMGHEVVGAAYNNSAFIYWTKNNKVYGGGQCGQSIFWPNQSYDAIANEMKEIELPPGSFTIVKVVLLHQLLVFLLYDEQAKTNRVFANGYYIYATNYAEKTIYNKELVRFIDENVQTIVNLNDCFICVTSNNELVCLNGYSMIEYNDLPLVSNNEGSYELDLNNIRICSCNILFVIINKKNNNRYFYQLSSNREYKLYYHTEEAEAEQQNKNKKKEDGKEDEKSKKKNKNKKKDKEKEKEKDMKLKPSDFICTHCDSVITGNYFYFPTELLNQIKCDKQKKPTISLLFKCYVKTSENDKEVIKGYLIKLKQADKNLQLILFDIKPIDDDIKDIVFKEKELYHFIDESETQGNYNTLIIEQLFPFTQSFQSINEIGLIDIAQVVSMNYPSNIMTIDKTIPKAITYSFYTQPKTELITIQNNYDLNTVLPSNINETVTTIKASIKEKLQRISLDYFKEYLDAKQAYHLLEKDKSNKTKRKPHHSLNEYMIEKYKNHRDYSLLSKEEYLDIISKGSKYYSSSLVSFKRFATEIDSMRLAKEVFEYNDFIDSSQRLKEIETHFLMTIITPNGIPISFDKHCKLYEKIYQLSEGYTLTDYAQITFSFEEASSSTDTNDIDKTKSTIQEVFNALFSEIIKGENDIDSLSLFIPTPNHIKKIGMRQGSYTINNEAIDDNAMKHYLFIGKMIGVILLRKINVNTFPISSCILKQLLYNDQQLTPEDIKEIDYDEYTRVFNRNNDLSGLVFNCYLSNGQCVDLINKGSTIPVTKDNYEEFTRLYLKKRYEEIKEQVYAIRRGLQAIIPRSLLFWFTMKEMNDCFLKQSSTIDINDLMKNALYDRYNANDEIIKWLWKYLTSTSANNIKEEYVKRVYGSETMTSSGNSKHIIRLIETKDNDSTIPVLNELIQRIDLPRYSTYDILAMQMNILLNQ